MQAKKHILKLFKGILLVVATIALTVVIKVFLFASFKVPTGSMEPTILPGDYVLVNKLLIGPRIYQDFGFLKGKKTPYKRIKGMRQIRGNDVLVFDAPYLIAGALKKMPDQYYVKRCVGVPGDIFLIENGIFKIRGYTDTLGNFQNQLLLSRTPDEIFGKETFNCFPYDTAHHWNIKHFGPLYIPGKGDCIELNQQNIALYEPLIQYETEKRITIKEGQIFLDGEPLSAYTFTQNYYFMAGDYVSASHDSRYWGLLPEDFVVGRATLIWQSENPETGRYRWNRFFKEMK